MKVSLSVILDALSDYSVARSIPNPEALYFSWAVFLPKNSQDLLHDRIYLCTLHDARQALTQSEGHYYICIADAETSVEALPPHCVVVHGVDTLITLAEIVQNRISAVRDWIARLSDSAVENPDYQELMLLSEPMLKNPIYILDASFKLLAHTPNLLDDDEIDIRLRERGYHSEEALLAFQKSNRFQVYNKEVGTLINPPGNPNKYATVGKWLWARGMPVIHIIMICSNIREPNDCLLALFEIVAQNCAIRFRQRQRAESHTGHYHDSLFNEVLFGNLDNPRIIAERVKMAGLTLEGHFNCYKIMLRDNDSYPIPRLMDELSTLLPDSKIISHGFEIISLNKIGSASNDSDGSLEVIRPFLKKRDAVCGISEPFTIFYDFPAAYTQATRAIAIGESLLAYRPVWKAAAGISAGIHPARDKNTFYYDDIFVYYAISVARTGAFDVYRKTPYVDIVHDLIQSDREQGTNNAQMLYTFLVTERRATKTGKLLHTHRNNILYHIPRIEERIGLSLDDYWIRIKLLLAFHLIELEGAQSAVI